MTVTDGSQIDGNSNNGPGGGIAANFEGAVTISDGSQVDGNTGAGLGGGIVNFSETFGISVTGQSQVAHNTLTNDEDALVTSGLISVGLVPAVERAFVSGGRGDAMLKAALQLFVNACAQRAPMIEQAVNAFPSRVRSRSAAGSVRSSSGPIEIGGGSNISRQRIRQHEHGQGGNRSRRRRFREPRPDHDRRQHASAVTPPRAMAAGSGTGVLCRSVTASSPRTRPSGTVEASSTGARSRRSNTSVVDNTPDNIYPVS